MTFSTRRSHGTPPGKPPLLPLAPSHGLTNTHAPRRSENIVPVSIFGFFVPVGTFFALNYEQEWLAKYDGRNTVFFPTKYQSDKGIPEPQWAGYNAKLYRQRKAASASQE